MILLRNSHKYQAPLVLLKMTRFAHQFSETYSLRKDGNTHIMPCTQLHTNSQNLGQCFREGNGTPLQHSCLENPMDGGAWWAAVRGVTKSQTQLNDFTFTFHFHALEKEMATHSSVLAWKIPGTGEPGGLLSMGSHRVWHDWSDIAAAAAAVGQCLEHRATNM